MTSQLGDALTTAPLGPFYQHVDLVDLVKHVDHVDHVDLLDRFAYLPMCL